MEFNFAEIEQYWRKYWQENDTYKVVEDAAREKFYVLDMFPYPSGEGLHVGHPLGYVASDILARYKRMKGFNVLHPMGFDAFGLPAEQYAVETGTHPEKTTEKAIARYREQLDKIGFNYDWSRMVKTSEPDYYKWTQWIFIQLFNSWYNRKINKAESINTLIAHFKANGTSGLLNFNEENHAAFSAAEWASFSKLEQLNILMHYRLSYQSFTEVNWCEGLGTVLANDEIINGKSERGGHPVVKKKMRQWSLRITEYSDRLLEGLDGLDWSESMKDMQRNWIGRSEGALIKFKTQTDYLEVFTTRADTIFGATFLVIAPEHELVASLTTAEQKKAMDEYIAYVKSRSDIERQQEKKVTGVFTGSFAVHPFSGEQVPIWLAEYVLAGYGTGAIMAVPADDERDKKFAEKFGLPIVDIVDKSMYPGATIEEKLGKMVNSDFLNGMEVMDAIQKVIAELEAKGVGKRKVNYKQRDAGFSRQRYWGEPFPVKYEGDVPTLLDESALPLILPNVQSFKPTGDGRSPLANSAEWVAQGYETDTMPGYAGSSWYFLRYMDPQNSNAFASKESLDYWKNVDVYLGGNEHAVGHLLYARLWHKILFDLGYVQTDEPFKKLVNQGMILGNSALVYKLDIDKEEFDIDFDVYVTKEIKEGWETFNMSTKLFFGKNEIEHKVRAEQEEKNSPLTFIKQHVNLRFVDGNNMIVAEEALSNNEKPVMCLTGKNPEGKLTVVREVEKMSKRYGNVVNPDDVIGKYGADCFRMFEMFLGPIEQSKPWDDKGISGVSSFLRKFWRLFNPSQTLPEGEGLNATLRVSVSDEEPTAAEWKVLHKTIKKVGEDIEKMSYNTSVSQFMIATNELQDLKCNKKAILEPLVLCLAPFAPFITEELWKALGNTGSVHHAAFPKFDAKYLAESETEYPVSINGKTRASIVLPAETTQEEAWEKVSQLETVQKWMEGKPYKKFVFVKGRIINIVV